MPKRLFVVDAHPVTRRGYRALLADQPDLALAGEADAAAVALDRIAELQPDLVLTSIALTGLNGIELTKRLRARLPDVPVLVIALHDECLYAERALQAGARGYIMKTASEETVLAAIRHVLQGHLYLSDAMATRILQQLSGHTEDGQFASLHRLSDRELEVFELIGRGHTTRAIAERLHVSPKTVESHRSRIKAKLDVASGTELLRQAMKWVEQAA